MEAGRAAESDVACVCVFLLFAFCICMCVFRVCLLSVLAMNCGGRGLCFEAVFYTHLACGTEGHTSERRAVGALVGYAPGAQ